MDIWGRFFKKRREAEAMINRIIGAAEERARTPKGPRKPAEWGDSIRAKLIDIIDSVEAASGSYAYVLAEDEQVLMVSHALRVALKEHQLSDLLEPAFSLLFVTRATKAELTENWPSTVRSFLGKRNDADSLKNKASVLACYIVNYYDIPCDVIFAETGASPSLDAGVEVELKLEAAASWYRLVDELAFFYIREERELFSDYLQDSLAELLALQGAAVDAITGRMIERSAEYAGIKDSIFREASEQPSSLLWQMGKHALAPLGADKNVFHITDHSTLLLRALNRAMVGELLLGRQRPDTEHA